MSDHILPDVRFLDPAQIHLRQGDREAPNMTVEGDRSYLDIRVRLAFPFSFPDEYLVLHDSKDEVIGMLKDITGLDDDSVRVVSEDLDRRYFRPEIVEIIAIREEYGCTLFDVVTSRGPASFTVRNIGENIRENEAGRLRIRDMHGSVYEIPDLSRLDLASRHRLELVT
jgi:hypothetical protein